MLKWAQDTLTRPDPQARLSHGIDVCVRVSVCLGTFLIYWTIDEDEDENGYEDEDEIEDEDEDEDEEYCFD